MMKRYTEKKGYMLKCVRNPNRINSKNEQKTIPSIVVKGTL